MKPQPKLLLCRIAVLLPVLCFALNHLAAQTVTAPYKGTLLHNFTREPVAFASIRWQKGGFGVISDSLGNFTMHQTKVYYARRA